MTLDELLKLQERLTYQGKRCLRIEQKTHPRTRLPLPDGFVYMNISIPIVDVDSGIPGFVGISEIVDISNLDRVSVHSYITTIKDTITLLQMHEIQETFAVDGLNIFNPHEPNPKLIKTAA